MRYNDRSAYQIGYHKYLVHFVVVNAGLVAFAKVVFNAIVAAQYHTGNQAKHFFGFYIKRATGIAGGIQREEAFDISVGSFHYPIVHPGAIAVKFFYKFSHFIIIELMN
jgi:hypothetical protein